MLSLLWLPHLGIPRHLIDSIVWVDRLFVQVKKTEWPWFGMERINVNSTRRYFPSLETMNVVASRRQRIDPTCFHGFAARFSNSKGLAGSVIRRLTYDLEVPLQHFTFE